MGGASVLNWRKWGTLSWRQWGGRWGEKHEAKVRREMSFVSTQSGCMRECVSVCWRLVIVFMKNSKTQGRSRAASRTGTKFGILLKWLLLPLVPKLSDSIWQGLWTTVLTRGGPEREAGCSPRVPVSVAFVSFLLEVFAHRGFHSEPGWACYRDRSKSGNKKIRTRLPRIDGALGE